MTEVLHDSDCAQHNEPAYPNGPCDCSAGNDYQLKHSVGVILKDLHAFARATGAPPGASSQRPRSVIGPLLWSLINLEYSL